MDRRTKRSVRCYESHLENRLLSGKLDIILLTIYSSHCSLKSTIALSTYLFIFVTVYISLQSCENNVACDLWHIVAKILLAYFTHHTEEIDLLFSLMKCICARFIPDFQVCIQSGQYFVSNYVHTNYVVVNYITMARNLYD